VGKMESGNGSGDVGKMEEERWGWGSVLVYVMVRGNVTEKA
jgi:hypothetical protein